MTKLIVANWKMNGFLSEAAAKTQEIARLTADAVAEVVICPPFVHIAAVLFSKTSKVQVGAQNCHAESKGAYTGDISASMLADVGCRYVILGHSERRQACNETSAQVQAKVKAALAAQLKPIICVGETLAERESGSAISTVCAQVTESLPLPMDEIIIAYEPIWAIGTGKNAAAEDVAAMHRALKDHVTKLAPAASIRLLYGGSVKPQNAPELLAIPDVDGLLVGGASLVPADFAAIVNAA